MFLKVRECLLLQMADTLVLSITDFSMDMENSIGKTAAYIEVTTNEDPVKEMENITMETVKAYAEVYGDEECWTAKVFTKSQEAPRTEWFGETAKYRL